MVAFLSRISTRRGSLFRIDVLDKKNRSPSECTYFMRACADSLTLYKYSLARQRDTNDGQQLGGSESALRPGR